MDNSHADLVTAIMDLLPHQSRWVSPIPSLALSRYDKETSELQCFYHPMVALVLQGFKHSVIGDHRADYGQDHCVVVGVDMPGVFHIAKASPASPFLSLSVKLDRHIISQLITEMPSIVADNDRPLSPVAVVQANSELLNAFHRLVQLLYTPERIPVLAPMILREIHFYLLTGPQGGCLRIFNTMGTQAHQIARAISWLREHYMESLHIETLARQVNMASSTFNRHFKQVTSLSPLQFQKRLRLYEAERLMLQEGKSSSTVALEVGYESVSQFTREYKRQFGNPPRQDIFKKQH